MRTGRAFAISWKCRLNMRLDKVVAPDMIAMLRPQADARAVIEPEPAAWLLLSWRFEVWAVTLGL
jgi:hypothetical protein